MQWLRDSGLFLSSTFLCLLLVDYGKAQCSLPTLKPGYGLTDDSSRIDTFPNGSSVAVRCGEGYYKTRGSATILCKNGTWTSPTLECTKKSCGSPGTLTNGEFDISEGIEFGATAFANCNPGFGIVGIDYRQCLSLGWSNLIPVCDARKCPDPPAVANGKISVRPSDEFIKYGDVIEYTCDKNFNLVGNPQIICNEHGHYEELLPKCKEINCPPPNIPFSFRIEGGPPPYELKHFVKYECRQGYVMNGTRKLVCEVDGWSSTFPTCIRAVTTTERTATTNTTKKNVISGGNDEDGSLSPDPDPTNNTDGYTWIVWLSLAIIVVAVVIIVLCLYLRSKKGSRGYRGNVATVDLEERDEL